jgi:transcriptional regulator GlxA family with amidase domain
MKSARNYSLRPLRVGILVTTQFTLNALANFVDVLRLASDSGDGSGGLQCKYHLMSAVRDPIPASCGYPLVPTSTFIEPADLDYVAVIGGLLYRGRSIDASMHTYLRAAAVAGTPLLGICTGTFILCRLGLMQNRRCCVSWFHYGDFRIEFPKMEPVADVLYVVDHDRITSSGGIGAALIAAVLVERHLGRSVAQKSLRIMQIASTTANWQPAPPRIAQCDNELVTRSLLLMEQNISEPLTIGRIAFRLHVSRRTLERQFVRHVGNVPRAVYIGLRLAHARVLLRTKKTMAQVASETGFSNSSQLSAAFRRQIGDASHPEPQDCLR